MLPLRHVVSRERNRKPYPFARFQADLKTSLLEEIAASDAVGELPILKKLLTVLAVALAVPQFSKRLLADVAYVVVEARIYATRRRDIHRGPWRHTRVCGRLEPIGV